MSVVFRLLMLWVIGALSAPFAVASQPVFMSFQGQPAYRLSAAEVFRLRGQAEGLSKTLRSMFGHLYYQEAEFKQALASQLDPATLARLYPALRQSALLPANVLDIWLLSDNTVQLHYGSASAQHAGVSELLDLSQLESPHQVETGPNWLQTDTMTLRVDQVSLCVTLSDRTHSLTRLCPASKGSFSVQPYAQYYLSGLGQEFQQPGVTNPYWNGKVRHTGNQMEGFDGGMTGNTQMPILYASDPRGSDFSLYLDSPYASEWDFSQQPWQVQARDGEIRLLLSVAEDQAALRKNYLTMTGAPLVPPRKMFGMWLSEYGFDNWQEMEDKLASLKRHKFPIDGVVMDLQWFGNVQANNPLSPMGRLSWDEKHFPQPQQKIADLKRRGIGMMLIEESYISEGLTEHQQMDELGYLARDPNTGKAINVKADGGGNWWGRGGMIDWINPQAAAKWHDWKREPLIAMGITGHWTDLGEPEMYNSNAVYADGQPHADIHNLYNYKWLESIYQGYQRHHHAQRPFMMSRSGAPGIQRFGAAMWSGDIGSDLDSLAVHIGMQTNMSLSGIDYYGSDIGGFHRSALKQRDQLDQTYTRWFAYSSLFDVPVRPHTENLCNCKQTAPDRIGDSASNLANIRLRYQLIPYLYSLAHQAYWEKTPLFPALAYHYPKDSRAWQRSNHKMLGDALLSVGVAKLDVKTTAVYLPAGHWFDYRSGKLYRSQGEQFSDYPLEHDGVYQLPLFARDGAVIPFNPQPQAGSGVPHTLGLKVFGSAPNRFDLYEDDGWSQAYRDGGLRKMTIALSYDGKGASLQLHATGQYQGMETTRPLALEWYLAEQQVSAVSIDGQPWSKWRQQGNRLSLSNPGLDLSQPHTIRIDYQHHLMLQQERR